MYKVIIKNGSTETLIHYPTTEPDYPHILSLQMKESLSRAEELSFSVPFDNPGYGLIHGLNTKVRVYDTRDESVVFSGRVIPTKEGMDSSGKFINNITCEGAMNYLIDTNTRRWEFVNKTPSEILQYLLDQHNSKVDNSRKIYLGVIQVTQAITISTNYETTLNAIVTKIKNILGGDIRVQERSGVLYFDYLTDQGANNGVTCRIGYNIKEILREFDPTDIITRCLPLGYGEGINQLNITSVNSGVEYIDDASAIATYGVIEGVVTNKDIQNAYTLKVFGQTTLNDKRQPKLSYSLSALDLSVLVGHENEKYNLGDTIHTIVDIMNIDVYARVVERDRDLLNSPWDPTLSISTRPITLTDQIIDLKQRSLSLENAPQGSTYIDTFGYAENIDNGHPFQLPVWISPDILNVNRVRLHIDGQKYRAYEKGMAAAGYTKQSSGPSSTSSSSSSGVQVSAASEVSSSVDNQTSNLFWGNTNPIRTGLPLDDAYDDHRHDIDKAFNDSSLAHRHYVTVVIPGHTHNIPGHSHNINHTHEIEIQAHEHVIDYGIIEQNYPKDVYVKVNGTTIAGPFGNGSEAISEDINLTPYIGVPGQTYNLEVTSSQNGRINAWVSVQAFIQAK